MRCPGCKSEMIILELNSVEVDYCCQCGGVWLDGGELELLMGQGQGTSGLSFEPAASSTEQLRKCPRCRKIMLKQYLSASQGERAKILLDSCPAGCGLWFDAGELQEALALADQDNVVIKQLQDIFGRKD